MAGGDLLAVGQLGGPRQELDHLAGERLRGLVARRREEGDHDRAPGALGHRHAVERRGVVAAPDEAVGGGELDPVGLVLGAEVAAGDRGPARVVGGAAGERHRQARAGHQLAAVGIVVPGRRGVVDRGRVDDRVEGGGAAGPDAGRDLDAAHAAHARRGIGAAEAGLDASRRPRPRTRPAPSRAGRSGRSARRWSAGRRPTAGARAGRRGRRRSAASRPGRGTSRRRGPRSAGRRRSSCRRRARSRRWRRCRPRGSRRSGQRSRRPGSPRWRCRARR